MLLAGHHIHADGDRREGREELGAHEVGQGHPSLGAARKDGATLLQASQELPGIEAVVDQPAGILVSQKGLVEQGGIERIPFQVQTGGLGEFPEQPHPGIQVRGEVVGMAHAGRIPSWCGDRIHLWVKIMQGMFQDDHGEDGCACRHVAGTGTNRVGRHHAGSASPSGGAMGTPGCS